MHNKSTRSTLYIALLLRCDVNYPGNAHCETEILQFSIAFQSKNKDRWYTRLFLFRHNALHITSHTSVDLSANSRYFQISISKQNKTQFFFLILLIRIQLEKKIKEWSACNTDTILIESQIRDLHPCASAKGVQMGWKSSKSTVTNTELFIS